MSIDIVIRQKGLFKKDLPLSVILGDHLVGGTYDQHFRLAEGHVSPGGEMAVYDPAHKARGFTVAWNRRSATLRALHPTTARELEDYYATVERIMTYWNATLEVDGNPGVPLETFLESREEVIAFNNRYADILADKTLEGEGNSMYLACALWPLHFGAEEARAAKDCPEGAAAYLAAWLHERQSVEAYYAAPTLVQEAGGIFGRFAFSADCPSIFPRVPKVPFGATDPKTGQPFQVEDYEIALTVPAKSRVLGTVPYDLFLDALEPDKVSVYDGGCILIAAHTEEELEALCLRARRNLV